MINWEELGELIKTRRSIRKFQDKPVPEELILKAIELATWAPNGGNYQPWRFLIITNKDIIWKIADAVRAKTELLASWPEAAQFGEIVDRWRKTSDFFRQAPVCVAVLMSKYSSIADQILKARGVKDPLAAEIISYREIGNSTLQSIAAFVSYFLLVLHYFGLGACWMAGPLQAKKEIEEILHIPAGWNFVNLIPVGYAAETPRIPERKPIMEVIEFYR